MNKRKTLQANKGMILTNGEIYGKIIILANGVEESTFYEITENEYKNILISLEERGIE